MEELILATLNELVQIAKDIDLKVTEIHKVTCCNDQK